MRRFAPSAAIWGSNSFKTVNHQTSHQLRRAYYVASTSAAQLCRASQYRFLRSNLALIPQDQISKQQFFRECEIAGLTTTAEAEECLSRFIAAGVVVVVAGDRSSPPDSSSSSSSMVFLRPARIVEQCHTAMGLSPQNHSQDIAAQLRTKRATLEAELAQLQEQKDKLDKKAGATRKLLWSAALFYSALQMYVMSRFTFIDFDWDIMEPVSFFLTTGTALVFMVWFLVKKEEHTYTRVDLAFLPRRLRKVYRKERFEYTRWVTLHDKIRELEVEIEKSETWKDCNA